jgi:hypothetical protein
MLFIAAHFGFSNEEITSFITQGIHTAIYCHFSYSDVCVADAFSI